MGLGGGFPAALLGFSCRTSYSTPLSRPFIFLSFSATFHQISHMFYLASWAIYSAASRILIAFENPAIKEQQMGDLKALLSCVSWNSNHQMQSYKMGDTWLSSAASEKDLGIVVDHKLNTSQQRDVADKKANAILCYTNRSIASKSRCKGSSSPDLISCMVRWEAGRNEQGRLQVKRKQTEYLFEHS